MLSKVSRPWQGKNPAPASRRACPNRHLAGENRTPRLFKDLPFLSNSGRTALPVTDGGIQAKMALIPGGADEHKNACKACAECRLNICELLELFDSLPVGHAGTSKLQFPFHVSASRRGRSTVARTPPLAKPWRTADETIRPIREALEQVHERLGAIIARLQTREEVRCLRWRCLGCGHLKHFTPPDARPRRPALPEVQRADLRGPAVRRNPPPLFFPALASRRRSGHSEQSAH